MNGIKNRSREARKREEIRLSYTNLSRLIAASMLFAIFALATPHRVDAAVYNIASGDVNALIAAINEANTNGEADTIYLAAGTYTLTEAEVNNEFVGSSGLPWIASDITINGASLSRSGNITTTIRRAANAPAFRIFYVDDAGTLKLDRLIINNGRADGYDSSGGGIRNLGTLMLTNCQIRLNIANSAGGGVINIEGRVSLDNCDVSDNSAIEGGGVYNSGTLTVHRSTFRNNRIRSGAGIFHSAGTLTITNSTISNNLSRVNGGGIFILDGTASLNHVTMASNVADADGNGTGNGGAIYRAATCRFAVNVKNSILALNTDRGAQAPDCSGELTSQGHNLVGNNAGCTFLDADGDQVGNNANPIDPLMAELQDNSSGNGSTQTHALLSGSPAIDAGNNDDCLSADQRNFVRPVDGDNNDVAICDIGAFERGAMPICDFTLFGFPRAATIVGTAGDDVIDGTAGPDRVHGLGGNDTIRGLGGNDIICGGTGNDILNGGGGIDILIGVDGTDRLSGGGNNDILSGGPGNDTLNGNNGDDSLFGDRDDDTLSGGDGSDDKCDGGDHVNGDTASPSCETVTNVP
jgi:Ca2+-binding RTX toxin-like protein